MDVRTETVQGLMEVGYLATGAGFHLEAQTIFAGVQAARPKSELPWIGTAIAQLNAGRAQEAATTLESQALRLNPKSDLARCFLALAHSRLGQNQRSRELLEAVVAENRDAAAVALANDLLADGPR